MKAPIAKKIPHTVNNPLGRTRVDDYHWIRDANWKEICKGNIDFADPEVKALLDAENSYTESAMSDTQELQQQLYGEMISRLKEDDENVPFKDGPYFYYSRTEKGKNYSIKCRKRVDSREQLEGAHEEIWFDVNAEAEPYEQYSMGTLRVSPNHKLVAYGFNTSGGISYNLRVRNLETGEDYGWELTDTNGSVRWSNDSEHLFYVMRDDESGRGFKVVMLHAKQGPESASVIFTKPEHLNHMFMNLSKTGSQKFIKIWMGDHSSNETWLLDANKPNSAPVLVQAAKDDVLYGIEHHTWGELYIHTNIDGATNFKVMRVPLYRDGKLADLSSASWKEYIPHSPDVFIEDISIYKVEDTVTTEGDQTILAGGKTYLIQQVTNNAEALSNIVISTLPPCDDDERTVIDMPDEAYSLGFAGACEYISNKVIYYYQSPTQPYQTIEYDLRTGERTVLKTKEVPNYNPELYHTERHFVKAHDGETIPLTLMYRKDLPLDGSASAYVYGYGSYGSGMTPYFSANRISLLDRGFVFAIAHVRGGDDKGYGWYLDGKLQNKKNTFLDFISCCEFLCEEKYTSRGKIAASGASAGGMLMGAIANMRPDLFSSITAGVAFVDVMNTMEDTSLPLTESEWNEWGNPLEDEAAYDYMLSYSPYDNVTEQDYPNMLFTSGVSDEQVTYWEPTKMVSKLRANKTDNNLLLLKMKMTAGHGGASKRYESYKELAFEYAFCIKTASKE